MEVLSIRHLLDLASSRSAHEAFISDPAAATFSFEAVSGMAGHVSANLRHMGVGRQDKVAIVMGQGVDQAIAFLSVATHCIAAPLNPSASKADHESWLTDLSPSCVIVQTEGSSQIREAALGLGIIVREWQEISSPGEGHSDGDPGSARPDDVALILHTSGTTARAKMVPLTHANLLRSARNISETLCLVPGDTCLCIMPLFHIHGIVACLLAPLFSGGRVVVPKTFTPEIFFTLLEKERPSWYSAVPTLHQRILAHAETLAAPPVHFLRLIRSSSAMLPPVVMEKLEARFGVPVIEAYGMTEAAHQMCSNPLPPAQRKAGSVGRMAGPEVAVVDASGRQLPSGMEGEVVIRGGNVTSGYLHLPEERQGRLPDGWLRTGDMGRFDEEGYLYLVGRLKEIVNRGGEKVSPSEVDEALLRMGPVAEAVCFGVPHPSLGEDLVAAVVLKPGIGLREEDIREHLLATLTHFKVPSRILILDQIPKSSIGKVQRLQMASILADRLEIAYRDPVAVFERVVAEVFASVLAVNRKVGSSDNFFSLGGDSLQATRVALILQEKFDTEVPATLLFRFPTPASIGAYLEQVKGCLPTAC